MNSIRFGNSQITYKIRRTKRTTTQIVVDNFGVKILTSEQKSQKQIQHLVKKHSKWIYKKKLEKCAFRDIVSVKYYTNIK